MESKHTDIIQKAYKGFNERDIDSVFALMGANVFWPKAFEGGHVEGYDAVREYWLRQWSEINPKVDPIAITDRKDGKVEVLVHQVVKSLDGTILFDGETKHTFTFDDGLIQRMDIE
jgi:hypothetical protein